MKGRPWEILEFTGSAEQERDTLHHRTKYGDDYARKGQSIEGMIHHPIVDAGSLLSNPPLGDCYAIFRCLQLEFPSSEVRGTQIRQARAPSLPRILRVNCEFRPIADAEFLVDAVEVDLHSSLAHAELGRDLPIAAPLRHLRHNSLLPLRKSGQGIIGAHPIPCEVKRSLEKALLNPASAVAHRSEAFKKLRLSPFLEHDAIHSKRYGFEQPLIVQARGQQDNRAIVTACSDRTQDIKATSFRHLNVKKEDVRPRRGDRLQYGRSIPQFGYDRETALS